MLTDNEEDKNNKGTKAQRQKDTKARAEKPRQRAHFYTKDEIRCLRGGIDAGKAVLLAALSLKYKL